MILKIFKKVIGTGDSTYPDITSFNYLTKLGEVIFEEEKMSPLDLGKEVGKIVKNEPDLSSIEIYSNNAINYGETTNHTW